jgi:tetratricopeptide (TPR) repeat protein
MVLPSSVSIAQSKGQMPFSSSSPDANSLLRKSWVALCDFKIKEGNDYIAKVLSQDPNCAMAYASIFSNTEQERHENINKAAGMTMSADEKMLVDGIKTGINNSPNAAYFEPLLKKYPKDYYLHLFIMFSSIDQKRSIEIGENIVSKNPKFAPVYNLLGYQYMAQNNLTKAETSFNKYIALRPELPNVYDSKGDFFMKAGKTEEAIPMYEKAFSLGMTSSKARAENAKASLKYPKPSEKATSEITKSIHASFAAYESQNIAEILKPYDDQSIEIFDNQMVNIGLPNLKERTTGMFDNGTFRKNDFILTAIDGVEPIALAYGKAESVWKDAATGKESVSTDNVIFLLNKKSDGNWKILADHFYKADSSMETLSTSERASIATLLDNWNDALKPGEILADNHFYTMSKLYSAQAIEIYPSRRSNVGIANIVTRWKQFEGVKMETNVLNPIGIQGLGRRAVAWGIANQNYYPKDSQELTTMQYPWAMILTKEKDNVWRILTLHWARQ